MLVVPLIAKPSQTITATLANQPCTINVYTLTTGLFVDLYVNDSPIVLGVIAENANRIVRDAYLGFVGDLAFIDNAPDPVLGPEDPIYTGLGSRFILIYYTADDLTAAGLAG